MSGSMAAPLELPAMSAMPSATPSPTIAPATAVATSTPYVVALPILPAERGSGLKVQYRSGDPNPRNNETKPYLQIVNMASSPAQLSELTIRYWFTADDAKRHSYWCDWAAVDCANVSAVFRRAPRTTRAADTYLEFSFTPSAGVIAPGSASGEIISRFAKVDWSGYDESNDYSFDPGKLAFADWSRVTLYRNGVLVWGVEP
jgi:hypothetical protein